MTYLRKAEGDFCSRIGSIATAVVPVLLFVSLAQADVATVQTLRGWAEKRLPGEVAWSPLSARDRLPEGSAVRTGTNSQLSLRTDRGHEFVVRSESVLELDALQSDRTSGRLEKGRVLSKVQKLREKESFKMQTPTAVCAVRGTEFDTISGEKGTLVAVYKGIVGVSALGSDQETRVGAGQMTSVRDGTIETPRPLPVESGSAERPAAARQEAQREVGLDMTRNEVIAAAALEQRLADYVEGKSLIDVEGRRVRLEEYIVRSRADQFKFVVLNHRDDRLDYFYYKGTFNKDLPGDLSVALRDLAGRLGTTAPEYHLTEYEMGQSNTQDSIKDNASGGHLVKVEVNSDGDYVLTDAADATNTRTVEAAELLGDGSYKIYNPLADSFSTVSAADKDAAIKFGVYNAENDSFRNLANGDTYWKTRFNSYTHLINGNTKITYTASSANNVLASRLDAAWNYAGGFVLPVVTTTPGQLDATITNYYGDGTFERYRTLLIDDQGSVAPTSAFAGVSSGADYKGELLKWNYQQQVSATEFEGRKIDLVVEPKIFIKSGLIQ